MQTSDDLSALQRCGCLVRKFRRTVGMGSAMCAATIHDGEDPRGHSQFAPLTVPRKHQLPNVWRAHCFAISLLACAIALSELMCAGRSSNFFVENKTLALECHSNWQGRQYETVQHPFFRCTLQTKRKGENTHGNMVLTQNLNIQSAKRAVTARRNISETSSTTGTLANRWR